MKRILIILAVIFVLAGLALFSAAFIASGFDFTKLDIAKYETNTYTINGDFDRIEVKSEEADITFKQSDDGKFRAVCTEREKTKYDVHIENGTLKIIVVDGRKWYDNVTLFSFKSQSIAIYLPDDEYEALKIDSGTGDIYLPKAFSFGDIDIAASTGDVVCGATSSGLLNIKTSTGNVNLSEVKAGKTEISVSTGNVALENTVISDSLNIKSSTGDVRFVDSDAESISVKTSTGDVTGTLKSAKIFTAKTSTGDISVPDTMSGGKCDITTSTGDIIIKLKK